MPTASDLIALPGFELDLAQMLLRDAAGSEVRLRPQAFAVLQLLARHAGRVVTKDELMQSVWAGSVVTDDSLVQCIKEIRLALHDHDHRIIRTAPKRGYWMVCRTCIAHCLPLFALDAPSFDPVIGSCFWMAGVLRSVLIRSTSC